MKQNWTYKKVKEVCDKASSTIVLNKIENNSGDYALYGASGFVKGIDFYHRDKPYIGIVKDGAGVGRVNVYPAKSSLVGTMQYILPKENVQLHYLCYALKGLNLAQLVSGATIPHIYFKDYGEFPIPLPPLATQTRIVSELDLLQSIIDKQKAQLKELDNLAQAIFYDMFGDNNCTKKNLGEVVKVQSGLVNPLETPYCDMIHIGPANIESHTGKLVDLKTAKEEKLISGKYLFDHSMVLYSKIRPNLNKVTIASFEGICSADMYPLKPTKELDKSFLLFILRQKDFLDYAISNSGRANIPKINREALLNYKIILPSLSLQQSFAAKIESIERQKAAISKSIAETEKLFEYTMDKYFG